MQRPRPAARLAGGGTKVGRPLGACRTIHCLHFLESFHPAPSLKDPLSAQLAAAACSSGPGRAPRRHGELPTILYRE